LKFLKHYQMKHDLDMLQKAGLLLSERHGKWTYYRRNEETLAALADYFDHEI
jgi:DNA-binding transcriptional ArsR family regulator